MTGERITASYGSLKNSEAKKVLTKKAQLYRYAYLSFLTSFIGFRMIEGMVSGATLDMIGGYGLRLYKTPLDVPHNWLELGIFNLFVGAFGIAYFIDASVTELNRDELKASASTAVNLATASQKIAEVNEAVVENAPNTEEKLAEAEDELRESVVDTLVREYLSGFYARLRKILSLPNKVGRAVIGVGGLDILVINKGDKSQHAVVPYEVSAVSAAMVVLSGYELTRAITEKTLPILENEHVARADLLPSRQDFSRCKLTIASLLRLIGSAGLATWWADLFFSARQQSTGTKIAEDITIPALLIGTLAIDALISAGPICDEFERQVRLIISTKYLRSLRQGNTEFDPSEHRQIIPKNKNMWIKPATLWNIFTAVFVAACLFGKGVNDLASHAQQKTDADEAPGLPPTILFIVIGISFALNLLVFMMDSNRAAQQRKLDEEIRYYEGISRKTVGARKNTREAVALTISKPQKNTEHGAEIELSLLANEG